MRRLITTAVITALMTLGMAGCGSHTTEEIDRSLDAADAYLSDGNLDDARKTADAVYGTDSARMTSRQMVRLSLLYMQLSDRSDDPTTVGQAINCHRMAYKANADSAAMLYSTLPVDLDPYGMMLGDIVKQLNSPRDIPADEPIEPVDSLLQN